MNRAPLHTVFILSGPAGVGKTTIWHLLDESCPSVEKIITTTSRAMRPGEVDGSHYHFVSKDGFEQRIHDGDLIEYAVVHGNYYGSTESELARVIQAGHHPIYIIEPQGMVHLKPILEDRGYRVVTIFMLPPDLDTLKERLRGRGTETEAEFNIRLATALSELEEKDFYDHHVTNENLEKTVTELQDIIETYGL